jgi:hypothetical protein
MYQKECQEDSERRKIEMLGFIGEVILLAMVALSALLIADSICNNDTKGGDV